MNSITVKRTQSTDDDFNSLVRLLDLDLNKRYNKAQAAYDQYNKIALIETVIVAYANDVAVGCGCFKPFDEKAVEIKRMFVHPAYRGKGISKIIIRELEKWATELGFTTSVLETGKGHPEAIGLYTKQGYDIIANFGQYADMPNSVCFEKRLR